MKSRRHALPFSLDAAVVAGIQRCDQFRFEVVHGIKFLQTEQFTFEQTKEIFRHGIIQTVALSTHRDPAIPISASVLMKDVRDLFFDPAVLVRLLAAFRIIVVR